MQISLGCCAWRALSFSTVMQVAVANVLYKSPIAIPGQNIPSQGCTGGSCEPSRPRAHSGPIFPCLQNEAHAHLKPCSVDCKEHLQPVAPSIAWRWLHIHRPTLRQFWACMALLVYHGVPSQAGLQGGSPGPCTIILCTLVHQA